MWMFVVILLISIVSSSIGENITRFETIQNHDEWPNPSNDCTERSCNERYGYQFCHKCCKCRCISGSYSTQLSMCLPDENFARGCVFASGGHYDHHGPTEHAHLVPIHKTSKEKLRRGIDIFHCHSPMKSCDLLLATNCTIDPVTTVYDNNGWKLLWKFARDFDWKVSDTGLSIQIKIDPLPQAEESDILLTRNRCRTVNVNSRHHTYSMKVEEQSEPVVGDKPEERHSCIEKSKIAIPSSLVQPTAKSVPGDSYGLRPIAASAILLSGIQYASLLPSMPVASVLKPTKSNILTMTPARINTPILPTNQSSLPENSMTIQIQLSNKSTKDGHTSKKSNKKDDDFHIIIAVFTAGYPLALFVILAISFIVWNNKRKLHSKKQRDSAIMNEPKSDSGEGTEGSASYVELKDPPLNDFSSPYMELTNTLSSENDYAKPFDLIPFPGVEVDSAISSEFDSSFRTKSRRLDYDLEKEARFSIGFLYSKNADEILMKLDKLVDNHKDKKRLSKL